MSNHPPPSTREHVLIVGAGFSGTLLAINLLRHEGPRVTLVERRAHQLARGVAYSAADDSHLLNVRAGNMSAFPDDPGHFVRWLGERALGDGGSFVRRTTYGAYLRELLDVARGHADDRLVLVEGEVVALDGSGEALNACLADGTTLRCDRAVLALGNLPPHAPAGVDVDTLPADLYCDDPWAADIAEGLTDQDTVLLLGTGLTAIDAALLLDRRGFTGQIMAMSRRGLRPRAHHDAQPPAEPRSEKPAGPLSQIVRDVRARAATSDWRSVVDGLRPVTQLWWSGADAATRGRFLRHLRPFWDVHRHRLAPSVAARIDIMVASGQLAFSAGKVSAAVSLGDSVEVHFRLRGTDTPSRDRFRRVVNCTGPQGDLTRTREPLLAQLLEIGSIRADCARLGIDIDATTRAIARDGTPDPRLHAIGPMTRGAYWEVVAVPDIRVECWNLARILANAHWVGGEGL